MKSEEIIFGYRRRPSREVRIGCVVIGGGRPVAVQSMTNTSTADTEASVEQIERIARAGAEIVRLTAQGRREAENLQNIVRRVREKGLNTAIVADIHFVPEMAMITAQYVDKVRINPGNFRTSNGELEVLVELCRKRGVALRIGVNHGSLSKHIFNEWGDTPQGMAASAMEFLRQCKRMDFGDVVVSMKSSNTRVMIYAYRLLVRAMDAEGMDYPVHLGVTEAGDGIEARIKSAVGIGALLADGIGDTLRVSLTEPPENEVPVGQLLADYFTPREGSFPVSDSSAWSPVEYRRRSDVAVPLVHDELTPDFRLLRAASQNPTAELRAAILNLASREPVAVSCRYDDADLETVAVKAAADMGSLFIDGLADGIVIEAPQFSSEQLREVELMILQASRVRFTRTEYIACPSCGRTLYDIESALAAIKARTSHLRDLKIGVMGCIVNGPGEMADADYGYVGAAPGRITLYRGREIIERNIPQAEALDRLVELIKADGRWREPKND
ncbi:MAG: (E)-4-hydroxy-3-methylbut-2-enyl-diphosphate synthase [Alistipes sp.]|nr:(E)-4-hydroxy-3-methylbut-2-enyl-diphosphate synthase [Alistipes sp.]